MKKTLITILLSVCTLTTFAQSMDEKIKVLANEIADQVSKSGKKTVAVSTLTFKDSQTEFGKLIAEKLSGKLAVSNRGIAVVNQKMLAELLKQNKLTAEGLLTNKNEAAKLGQASSIEALVYGVITSFGEELQLTINIVELNNYKCFWEFGSFFPLTSAIKNMLNVINESESTANTFEGGSEPQTGLNGKWLYYANEENGCQDLIGAIVEFKDDKAIFTVCQTNLFLLQKVMH